MKFNYNKLRGRIREILGTESKFTELMPMNRGTVSLKLNGQQEWTQSEILVALKVLKLSKEDIGIYFFNEML